MTAEYVNDIWYEGRVYVGAYAGEPMGLIFPHAYITVVDADGQEVGVTLDTEHVKALHNLLGRVHRKMKTMPTTAPE